MVLLILASPRRSPQVLAAQPSVEDADLGQQPAASTESGWQLLPTDENSPNPSWDYFTWEDSDGMLWVAGTTDRVRSFDPATQTWRSYPVVAATIWEGANGKLWFGTLDAGAAIYDKELDSWERLAYQEGLPHPYINDIWADDQGQVWIVSGGLVCRFDESLGCGETLPAGSPYLLHDNEGIPWFSVSDGVMRYDEARGGWQRFTVPDGLISSQVQMILRDSSDRLWFGTQRGLGRYDEETGVWHSYTGPHDPYARVSSQGHLQTDRHGDLWITWESGVGHYDTEKGSWQTFTQDNGLCGEFPTALHVDASGQIWVGTHHGLSWYDPATGNWQTAVCNDESTSNGWSIYDISVQGDIAYLARGREGVSQFDAKTGELRTLPIDLDRLLGGVSAIWGNGHGVLWLGNERRSVWDARAVVGRYNIETGELEVHAAHGEWEDVQVTSIWGDGERHVWFGTERGALQFDAQSGEWAVHRHTGLSPGDSVQAIWGSEGAGLWLGTPDVLYHYDVAADRWQTFTQEAILGARAIWGDKRGRVWIGTAQGVSRIDTNGGKWDIFAQTDGFPRSSVQAIWGDGEGRVWFGTSGGVNLYDDRTQAWSVFPAETGAPQSRVTSIWGGGSGLVWVAAGTRVYRYDVLRDTWRSSEESPYDIRSLSGNGTGGLWMSPSRGDLYQYEAADEQWKEMSSLRDFDFFYTGASWGQDDGSLWVSIESGGGQDGLRHFDAQRGSWETITAAQGLPAGNILALWGDGRGKLWVGLEEGGVARYDSVTGSWQRIYQEGGLLVDDVRVIAGDEKGEVWFGTGAGLSRYDPASQVWTSYPSGEGPATGAIEALWVDDERVWTSSRDPHCHDEQSGIWQACLPRCYSVQSREWESCFAEGGLVHDQVSKLIEDRSGGLWLTTGRELSPAHLQRYNAVDDTWEPPSFMDDRMRYTTFKDAWSDGEGRLWMRLRASLWPGGYNDSMAVCDPASGSLLTTDYVRTSPTSGGALTWCDHEGNCWAHIKVGEQDFESMYMDSQRLEWEPISSSGPLIGNAGVKYAWADEEELWLTNGRGGIVRYSKAMDKWQGYFHEPIASGDTALWGDKDFIWVGTQRGLARYDRHADIWDTWGTRGIGPSAQVRSIWGDKADTIWFGTDSSGVSLYDIDTANWQTFSLHNGLPHHNVRDIAAGPLGVLWFATEGGLGRFDWDAEVWQTILPQPGSAQGPASENLTAVWYDGVNSLWIGTGDTITNQGKGVSRYDFSTRTWQTFTIVDGLASDFIRPQAIWGDGDGTVWFDTWSAVSRYDAALYDAVDSPGSHQRWATLSGRLIRGPGTHRVVDLHRDEIGDPQALWYAPSPPQIQIDGLILPEGTVLDCEAGTELSLPYGKKSLQMAVSAMGVGTVDHDVRYRYRLEREGESERWHFFSGNQAEQIPFSTLEEDHYTFSVAAGNANLDWSEPETCTFWVPTLPPKVSIDLISLDGTLDSGLHEAQATPFFWRKDHTLVLKVTGHDDQTPAASLAYCFRLDGVDEGPCSQADWIETPVVTYTLAAGVYTFTAQARDTELNVTQQAELPLAVVTIPPPRYETDWPQWLAVSGLLFLAGVVSLGLYRLLRGRHRRKLVQLYIRMLPSEAETGYQVRITEAGWRGATAPSVVLVNEAMLERDLDALRRNQVDEALLHGLGERLFQTLFPSVEARRSLRDPVIARGDTLRLHLDFEKVPELAALPWEYLYNEPDLGFLALSAQIGLARIVSTGVLATPSQLEPPPSVLVVSASPTGLPTLSPDREIGTLREALAEAGGTGRSRINELRHATLDAFRLAIAQGYDIVHFTGHGAVDSGQGLLYFEDAQGHPSIATQSELSLLLRDSPPRLLVLNACQSAEVSGTETLEGLAPALIAQSGVPAVLGMQYPISGFPLSILTRAVYRELARNGDVERAVSLARQSMFGELGAGVRDWGTPVLYLGAGGEGR
jgi:ligand-binding sensor domain-containing protein